MENLEKNNVYANDLKGKPIHVSMANSGRKGYYCLGCGREMQAVKSSLGNRIDYFRHDAKDVVNKHLCTYSDETYRHKLAKEILQRIKRIKVPDVRKYPPKGQDGAPNLLEKAKFIEATYVEIEVSVFEDEFGNIHFQRSKETEGQYLLIKPDVVFYDADKKPILFIELVATHGLTDEKKVKLRRLGIDAVQVKIPRDSPQSIENNFSVTEKTKWIYNNVEQNATYIPVPSRNSETIQSVDELERGLYEESFKCRASEIGGLIRTIRKCLEGEQFRRSQSQLGKEISRVKRNTKSNRSGLERLREYHRDRVVERLKNEINQIESEENELEEGLGGFRRKSEELGGRYRNKKSELINEESQLDESIQREVERDYGDKELIEGRRRKLSIDRTKVEGNFGSAKGELERSIERERSRTAEIVSSRSSLPGKCQKLEEANRTECQELEDRERENGERIRNRFAELRIRAFDTVKARDGNGNNDLSRGISELLHFWKLLNDYEAYSTPYGRYRKAWNAFKEGTYKNWEN